jgi:hypothetical protein
MGRNFGLKADGGKYDARPQTVRMVLVRGAGDAIKWIVWKARALLRLRWR